MKIETFPETMTHRERVLKTFAFEKTDRVTIGYEDNPGIHARLSAALGVRDYEELYRALGVDYRAVGAPYTGPLLYPEKPGRNVNPLEGCYTRYIRHSDAGGYWDFCDFPLKDAEDEAFDAYPVPDPDNFDYDAALAQAKSYGGEYALYIGNPGIPDIINSNGRIMGMEDVLICLIEENEAALRFMRRRAAFQLGMMERLIDKCRGYIDFMWLGEDLGTQIAPMISPELYRKLLKPIHKQFAELADAYHIPSMIHTCGSSSWAYEDFIGIGIRGVDTLQPEAADMSPASLAARFGGRLNLRGCISTAGPLVTGTPDDVTAYCRKTLETLMPYRGYHFAPTHQIQDNTPTENVIAMYNAAHRYGRY